MARIAVDQLIELFHQLVEDLDCEQAEKVVSELRRREEFKNDGFKRLGFTSWGQLLRKIGTWCPRARRNRDQLTQVLTSYGFDEQYIYVPKVVLNADTLTIEKLDEIRTLVICEKEGYPSYKMIYDMSSLIYLFNKMNNNTESIDSQEE